MPYTEQKKLYMKEYREANREKLKEQNKEYREKNREQKKLFMKEYYQKNKEQINEQNKEYREANKEYDKEYYQLNKEKINQYNKEYSQTEAGKKVKRISNWKRWGVINDDYNALYDYYKNCKNCEECNIELIEGYFGNNKKCLDHDHQTGLFRNVLCHICNVKRR
jgi:hypothetical protein